MGRFDREWQLLLSSRGWLVERGYRLLETRGPEGMDSGFDLYTGGQLGIRVTADRGQWWIEAHPGPAHIDAFGWDGWFNLEAWSTCLGAPVLFHDTRPKLTDEDWAAVLTNSWWLEPQMDYLRDHLAEIEQACAPERLEATVACLLEAHHRGTSQA